MAKNSVKQLFTLKNDKYQKERGGTAKFWDISCAACGEWLLLYQKDGVGAVRRIYLNRIFAPSQLAKLQDMGFPRPQDMDNLVCSACDSLIGVPMRHVDGRLAYRLRHGSFSKRKKNDR